MAHDVFISYSARDRTTADAVCATLEAQRMRCWIAPRDVLAGMNYAEALMEAIGESRIMVLVFSSHSNRSQQVINEIEAAVNRGIPILPFRIENVPPTGPLEFHIRSRHWLDAWTPPLRRHLDRLAETVEVLLSRDKGQLLGGQPIQRPHKPTPFRRTYDTAKGLLRELLVRVARYPLRLAVVGVSVGLLLPAVVLVVAMMSGGGGGGGEDETAAAGNVHLTQTTPPPVGQVPCGRAPGESGSQPGIWVTVPQIPSNAWSTVPRNGIDYGAAVVSWEDAEIEKWLSNPLQDGDSTQWVSGAAGGYKVYYPLEGGSTGAPPGAQIFVEVYYEGSSPSNMPIPVWLAQGTYEVQGDGSWKGLTSFPDLVRIGQDERVGVWVSLVLGGEVASLTGSGYLAGCAISISPSVTVGTPETGTWSGTTSQGRTVEFDVTEGGTAITRIKIDVEGECPLPTGGTGLQPTGCKCEVKTETNMTKDWPIADTGFSYAPGNFEFSAVFDSPTTASGFVRVHSSGTAGQSPCSSDQVTWTASPQ